MGAFNTFDNHTIKLKELSLCTSVCFYLFRSGSALLVVAFVTVASAVSVRAAAQPAYCFPWLSTMASPTSTPILAGGERHQNNKQLYNPLTVGIKNLVSILLMHLNERWHRNRHLHFISLLTASATN